MVTSFQYSTDIEMRFSDLDAYGHVNNATYFTYLETARTKLFSNQFVELLDSGIHFFVVRAECEYQKSIEFAQRVVVSMKVVRIGNSSFDIDYLVHDGNGTSFARAKTVMVCFDRNLEKPVPVPQAFRKAIS